MSDKATEVWKRIHNNIFSDGLIAQIQRLHDVSHSALYSSVYDLGFVAHAAQYQDIYTLSRVASSALQIPILNREEYWEQFSQSIITLTEELQDIISEINWEPSNELTNSINCTIQDTVSFQKETKSEITLGIPTDKPLTKNYIRQNIWNILGILLSIISILLYFAPNPNEEVMIDNQHTMIEQNNEQLELDRKRNELLQQLCDTVQAINEETDIAGDQTDTLIEQPNDLTQAADSPSGDDTANGEQQ